jgi:transposase
MATDNDKHHRRLHLRHGVSPADGSPAPPRAAALTDRLGGPTMIGIDEKSCGKGADRFLTVVTDHVTGKIAWIAEGRSRDSVTAFFDALGPERARMLTHVSADGAQWIHDVVRDKARRP